MIKQSNQKSLHYKTCSKLAMQYVTMQMQYILASSLKFCNLTTQSCITLKIFYISSLKFQLSGFINNKCSGITHNLSFENRCRLDPHYCSVQSRKQIFAFDAHLILYCPIEDVTVVAFVLQGPHSLYFQPVYLILSGLTINTEYTSHRELPSKRQ